MSTMILAMLLSNAIIFPVSATSTWSKPRPSDGSDRVSYDETIGNNNNDGIASIGMGVHIGSYYDNDEILGDFLTFRVSVSSNTRGEIQYNMYEEPWDYYWYEVSTPTGIIYDNQAVRIPLPFTVQYYGVIYDEVWIYDDGFISFDPNSTSTTPQSIPSTNEPNSIVAPFWRDLNPEMGGSITYGTVEYNNFLVISWNNVPNKNNGVPQTFQIVMNNWGGYSYEYHNIIFFQYKSITLDQPTAVGTEDQVGVQSTTFDYTSLYNGLRLRFRYWTEGYRLTRLTIRLTKSDSYARIDFMHSNIGGYNVVLEDPETNPYGSLFVGAIGFAVGLLVPPKLGIMYGILLLTYGEASLLSENLSPPIFQVEDASESENEAYVYSDAVLERNPGYDPFDATLAADLIWSFTDPNDRDHSITITAESTYQDLATGDSYEITTSATLDMYINPPPPPGGGGGEGCPYVSTWNGSQYVLDNNLLMAAWRSGGTDVTDYYLLQQTLAQRPDGTYSLLLSEFESEHDFLDRAQLLAVDHDADVNVAVSPYGEILTYTNPSPSVAAIDNNNRNVKHLLDSIDGNYYESTNGSYIVLNFGDLDVSQGAKLVMRADMLKMSIHIQVQDENNNWNTVATVIPRRYWATEIIDMSEHLPDAKDNLKVRLYFTATHKLDFVGLDTSPQATINVQEGQLISATHSVEGDVTNLLLHSDDTYAELIPNQQIQLTFTLPEQTMENRNYIIITEGHYYTIQT